jgi:uncharacterized peroxidase-related enzyme
MRLRVVEEGYRLRERLILGLVRLMSGDAPDIMRALFHRPALFGRPLGAITNRAMRQPGYWSVAERELFAAYVSQCNRCEFCIVCHGEYAAQAGDRHKVERTLRSGADKEPRLDAALDFLAAFTAGPDMIESSHLEALRRACVPQAGIRDLAYIAFVFCVINRVADALEFDVPPPAQFARSWRAMRGDRGYKV